MNPHLFAVLLVGMLLLAVPAVGQADAGVPMIALLWPSSWVVLLPIIFLEAHVAKRVLAVPREVAVKLSAKANLVSTLAGIPLTWLVLFLLELLALNAGIAGDGRTRPSPVAAYLLLPLMAPLGVRMFPSEDQDWDLVAAAMWLCGIFFLVSVWLEARVVAWRSGISIADARRWSWRANLASYGIIEAVLIGVLVWVVVGQ